MNNTNNTNNRRVPYAKSAVKGKPPVLVILKKRNTKPLLTKRNNRYRKKNPYNPGQDFHITQNKVQQEQISNLVKRLDEKEKEDQSPKTTKGVEKEWWEKILDAGSGLVKMLPSIITGLGDYDLQTNSLAAAMTDGKIGNDVPLVENTSGPPITRHREYLGDIYSSTAAFTPITFSINPGLDQTFPWLSFIANNYEAYRFRGLLFEFKSNASEYTNSVGLGYVAIATQYNSNSTPFVDKKSLLNHEFSNSDKPSNSFLHPVECKPSQIVLSELYTRAGTPSGEFDVKMYDLGKTTIAVGGMTTGGVVIGELYVTYEVEHYVPKTASSSGINVNYDDFILGAAAGAVPLGAQSSVVNSPYSNLGGTLSCATPSYTFPNGTRGRFLFIYTMTQSSGAVVYPILTYTNITPVSTFPDPANSVTPQGGVTCTQFCVMDQLDVILDGAVITFGTAGTIQAGASGRFVISQVPKSATISEIFDPSGKNYDKNLQKVIDEYNENNNEKMNLSNVLDMRAPILESKKNVYTNRFF